MNSVPAEQLITIFQRLRTEEPKIYYSACGYGDSGGNGEIDIMDPFVSGSYELGLVAGAKYALEHLAFTEIVNRLIEETCRMRQLQKDYFRTRRRDILTESRCSEALVDKLLAELETPNLFEQ